MEKVKRCAKCKEEKPHSEFPPSKTNKSGLFSYCAACNRKHANEWRRKYPERERESKRATYEKHKERRKAESRARYVNNKEAFNNSRWKSLYGISRDEAKALLVQQGGVCKLCGEIPKKPCVDHCHNTKKVRGVLCNHCNLAIGHARENIELLNRMITYIQNNGDLYPVDCLTDESDAGWLH